MSLGLGRDIPTGWRLKAWAAKNEVPRVPRQVGPTPGCDACHVGTDVSRITTRDPRSREPNQPTRPPREAFPNALAGVGGGFAYFFNSGGTGVKERSSSPLGAKDQV